MFNCYTHGWSSMFGECPKCIRYETSTTINTQELKVEMRDQYHELKEELERLKKIIAKELSENDEFGCEFVMVNILREENKRFREALKNIELYKNMTHYPDHEIAHALLVEVPHLAYEALNNTNNLENLSKKK